MLLCAIARGATVASVNQTAKNALINDFGEIYSRVRIILDLEPRLVFDKTKKIIIAI